MEYIICYEENGANTWECVSGEDSMQDRVCEIMDEYGLDEYGLDDNDILVFEKYRHL